MLKLLIGIILILLNYSINIGNIHIELIPDFLGYIVLYMGLKELKGYSVYFQKNQKYAIVMVIFSGVLYVVSFVSYLADIAYELNTTIIIVSFIYVTMMLYIIFNMIKGFLDMERQNNVSLKGSSLMLCLKGNVISLLGMCIFSLLGSWMGYPAIIEMIAFSLNFIFGLLRFVLIAAMARTYYYYKKVDYGKII